MNHYQITIYASIGDDLHRLSAIDYDTPTSVDPGAIVTVDLDILIAHASGLTETTNPLARLDNPETRSTVAEAITNTVWASVDHNGGVLDATATLREINCALTDLAKWSEDDERARTIGWIVGASHWGDLILPRHTAESWADTWTALNSNLTWDELAEQLPDTTRDRILDWISTHTDDPEELRGDVNRDWADLFDTEWGGWPWLATDDHQASPADFPSAVSLEADRHVEYSTTPDGDYATWTDVNRLIRRFHEAGYMLVRDDELISTALGPFSGHRISDPEQPFEICPSCGQGVIVPIVYGYPGPEMEADSIRGEIILGGCVIREGSPTRACNTCLTRSDSRQHTHPVPTQKNTRKHLFLLDTNQPGWVELAVEAIRRARDELGLSDGDA